MSKYQYHQCMQMYKRTYICICYSNLLYKVQKFGDIKINKFSSKFRSYQSKQTQNLGVLSNY